MVSIEFDFFQSINILSKSSDKKLIRAKVKELTKFALSKLNAYYAYRLAFTLDKKDFPIDELEEYIISLSKTHTANQRYLLIMAMNVDRANIERLESAVIETKNAELLAEFSCFVEGARERELEDLVLALKVPRASYVFMRHSKDCQKDKHKAILIKSGKSRYLYSCAKNVDSMEEQRMLEDLICKNKSHYYVRLMANLPNADIEKLENRIIASEDFVEIRKMYEATKSNRLAKFVLLM